MGIYEGAGIHGTEETYSLGTAASHGCVRMSIPDVKSSTTGSKSARRSTSADPLEGAWGGAANLVPMTWKESLAAYDRDLMGRGLAERTRAAPTASTSGSSRSGRSRRASGPATSATATCAATGPALSAAGRRRRPSPASSPRSAASTTSSSATERVGQNPADLVSSPKREQKLPRVLTAEQMRSLLERIPARTPLELRDRAMLELAYSCGLRCEEIVNLDLGAFDYESEQLRVLGKGSQGTAAAGRRARPARAASATRPARPPRPRHRPARAGALPLQERPPPLQLRRHAPARALGARGGARRRRLAALPAPQLRHPSARRRGGPAHDPGAARPRLDFDHSGLYAGRRRPACGTPMPPPIRAHERK